MNEARQQKLSGFIIQHYYIFPFSTSEQQPSVPTMMWSNTRTSTNANASLSLVVRSMSAWLGCGLPDGWLCVRIIAAALCSSASFTTSRGYTDAESIISVKDRCASTHAGGFTA